MNSPYVERPSLIKIAIADRNQSLGSLRIEFNEAPPSPTLGSVSSQVGEVMLSLAETGHSTLLVSLGKSGAVTPEIFRQAGGGLARWLLKSGVDTADLNVDMVLTRGLEYLSALLEGILF